MAQSKRFELHVYIPDKEEYTWGSGYVQVKDTAHRADSTFHQPNWELVPFDFKGLVTKINPNGIETRIRVSTSIRCWDERSYFMCLMVIKERAFGFINQRHFVFVDLDTGEEHELKSEAVKAACKATIEDSGHCYRFRSTIRNS